MEWRANSSSIDRSEVFDDLRVDDAAADAGRLR
jgi:hypothetical protein